MADESLIPASGPSGAADSYNQLLALYGRAELIPSSIMTILRKKADRGLDEHAAVRDYQYSLPESFKEKLKDPKVSKALRSMYRGSGGGANAGTLSKFPQEIGRAVVLFYSEPGDTVVDPFAGHNSRMELCVRAGRNYIGCDLSTDFMEFNKQKAVDLRRQFPGRTVKVHHCDSRKQPIADGIGDMTITSPPYWNIEDYGDEPEQLGKCVTYADFMDGMRPCVAENFRTLKPGAYSCWFINDFRIDGVMYFYHADLLKLGEQVGFIPHDLMVVDLGRGLRDCFVNKTMRMKIIPKRHEYCIVFQKPETKCLTG